MNLILDIGNTNAKIGLFENADLKQKINEITPTELQNTIQKFSIDRAIVSNVGKSIDPFHKSLITLKVITLSHRTPLPIHIKYDTPETLGHDRIAAACGAHFLFPDQPCLIIDCGTCITYDVVTANGTYLGGAISPGLQMRLESLNTFTSNLPLVSVEENIRMVGKSTKQSIQSGVVHGILGEMEVFIHRFSEAFQPLKVVMCGGDTYFFENKVKARIFAAPELVLRGLNRILQHNA
ncbi:MAG: type III pantothenate kinase [Bacteroidota bacterium]